MIPSLDENGFLPVGIHDCTLKEIKETFGSFDFSDRRPTLFQNLERFVTEVRSAHFALAILIDGSFATAKPDPNDIDVVMILPRAHDMAADLLPAQYNLVSRRRVQRRFGFDMVAVREGTLEFDDAVAFFSQVRGSPTLRKGILRLLI